MTEIVTRFCHDCQTPKPVTEFGVGNTQCHDCKREARKGYRHRPDDESIDSPAMREKFRCRLED